MEYEAGRKVSNYTQYSYLLETKNQYKEAAPNPSVKIWYFVEWLLLMRAEKLKNSR
jgi:hypothetical protein